MKKNKGIRNPNGYGSVYEVKGNRRKPWRARVTTGWELNKETGNLKQELKIIGSYATKREAVDALAKYNTEKYNLDTLDLTFAEVYEKWSETKFPFVSYP